MPLTKLQFRPGIVQDLTSYSNEGGWRDGDKVRFRLGYPEKLGGWEKYTSSTFLGSCRALHNWVSLDGSNFLGVGTHLKYYIESGEEELVEILMCKRFSNQDLENVFKSLGNFPKLELRILETK